MTGFFERGVPLKNSCPKKEGTVLFSSSLGVWVIQFQYTHVSSPNGTWGVNILGVNILAVRDQPSSENCPKPEADVSDRMEMTLPVSRGVLQVNSHHNAGVNVPEHVCHIWRECLLHQFQ